MAAFRTSAVRQIPQTPARTRTGQLSRRAFSCSRPRRGYDDTVQNLKIGKHTRVIYQGFTGRVATTNAKDSLEYGTNIVGGVTPGKEGEHLGLPLLPDLKRAAKELKPDATAVFVAAPQCGKAIEDAIEAEIPLIVAVAEHIPLHDVMRVTSILKTQSKSRLVGANAPGIISPIGSCRIGFQPLPTFSPGHIGIVAKSGTLSYEAVASVTRSGLGQSLCIGMGGDIIAGTNIVDGLKVFETDPDTEGIIIVGEVGGRSEEDAAEWIKDYLKRTPKPKPIAALVGGLHAPPGRIMGHAGAWAARGEKSAQEKYQILKDAGATMVDHPEKFGGVMKTLLSQAGRNPDAIVKDAQQQKRGYHSVPRRRPITRHPHFASPLAQHQAQQRRHLLLRPDQAPGPLEPYLKDLPNVSLVSDPAPDDAFYIGLTVDRSERSPCIRTSPVTDVTQFREKAIRFPFDQRHPPPEALIQQAVAHTGAPQAAQPALRALVQALATMYTDKEAVTLSASLSISSDNHTVHLHQPSLLFQFDDSAFKSSNRQQDIHALRDRAREVREEVEAEKDGIVFVKFPADAAANIGTLVNGAGLAMNTVDALRQHGGRATNFLDTGGKATSATVKRSFELILQDERVKVIFVNIFGGLTDGGMIAEGILLAFKEVDMRGVPVVVRIRGTNEEKGQRIIAESGLDLEAFDGFEEAARRVVEIANSR